MSDGRRLTSQRVAGFALEKAFQCVLLHGLFGILTSMWSTVDIKCAPKRPEATQRWACFTVQVVHQNMIMEAVCDIVTRLQDVGFVILAAVVNQVGHRARHDLLLEFRKVGQRCTGQYSGELKVRTSPADRARMRSDCSSLFAVACRSSQKWLGQLVIVAEITTTGEFIRSRAELIVRGQPRESAANLWGWSGRPRVVPPSPPPNACGPLYGMS